MNTIVPLAWISGGEGLIIFFAILMLFGAKRLPELARGLGSAIREFSKAKDEVEREITRPPSVYEPRIEAPPETHPHSAPYAGEAPAHVPAASDDPHSAPAQTAAAPGVAQAPSQPQHPAV
jgi:sec-independent protein translocase protein TatA